MTANPPQSGRSLACSVFDDADDPFRRPGRPSSLRPIRTWQKRFTRGSSRWTFQGGLLRALRVTFRLGYWRSRSGAGLWSDSGSEQRWLCFLRKSSYQEAFWIRPC